MFLKIKDILKSNPISFILILFCVAVSGITFNFSHIVGLVELIVTAALSSVLIYRINDTVKRKAEEIDILNSILSSRGSIENELQNFPFPTVIIKDDGSIEWFNTLFSEIVGGYPSYDGMNIRSVLPKINFDDAMKTGYSVESRAKKRKYTVYSSCIDEGLAALYFVDDTKLKDIRKNYVRTRPAVLLISVDSLEQAEDELDHESYVSVIAEVEGIISKWLAENNCFFRKFSNGKFAAITEKENLDIIIQKNFDILEKVRSHHFVCGNGDSTDLTVSVGVGCKSTFRECETEAKEMLEYARGRGGDQAVILKNGEKDFYGAFSIGKEKRGKAESRQFSSALDELIQSSSDILVMGHSYGDFDCIGAAVGIAAMARSREKEVHIVANRETSMALNLITMIERERPDLFISPEKAVKFASDRTLLVITDTMRATLVECPQLLTMNLRTVIIDHHRKPRDPITGSSVIEFQEPVVSSTCEMVTELVQYSHAKLTPIEAQAILAGIMLDTKDYTLRAGVRTFQAAAYLKECKADTVAVRKLFCGTAEENIAVCKIVSLAKMYGRCAVSVVDQKIENEKQICSKAADELLNINAVDASFVIYPLGEKMCISARSLGQINVQLIMEKLGGGGHLTMAAAQLKCDCSEARSKLFAAIDEYKKESEK